MDATLFRAYTSRDTIDSYRAECERLKDRLFAVEVENIKLRRLVADLQAAALTKAE